MSADTWTIRFGTNPSHIPAGEFFCLIRDELGDPVDTFYGTSRDVFAGVAALLESHATGRGLGSMPLTRPMPPMTRPVDV